MPTVCLIVPCFDEAARLDLRRFGDLPPGVTCLFVNDGSRDATGALLQRLESPRHHVLHLERNVGKGEAIRQGVLHARASGLLDATEWVGYWDADLATPLEEVSRFFAYEALEGERADAILGSRIYKLGSHISRSYARHLLGRAFATVVGVVLRLDCYDSQCGAKVFRTEQIDTAFGEPFISRWIFDVEILIRLRGRRLLECPLRAWSDVPASKIRIPKVAARTIFDLVRIWRRYGTTRAMLTRNARGARWEPR